MASYEASIKVLVEAQQAFRALQKLEDRLKNIQDKATKAQIKAQITESARDVRRAEQRLKAQIDLNAATELYQRRLTQINRAGGARNEQQRKELSGLAKIIETQGNNARIVQKVATATGRILEVIRETNRTDKRSNALQSQVRAYQKQIDLLREAGVAESELNKLTKLRDKLSDQQSKKQLDLAVITKDQLDRKLKILQTEVKLAKAADATAAAEKAKLQQQGLALRRLAGGISPLIRKAGGLDGPAQQLALPNTRLLGAQARGLKRIETSEERIARFAQRTAEAKAKSAARTRDILEANKAAAKAGERNAKAAERAAAAADRTAQSAKRTGGPTSTGTKVKGGLRAPGGGRLGSLATGVGFPLLFGGGLGSVAGGAVGSLLGGFPGSILGSALGQTVDNTTRALSEFASGLKSASISLEDLSKSAGLRGTPVGTQIKFAEILGIPEAGRKEAEVQIATVVGEYGVKKFKELGKSTDDLSNAFSKLTLKFGSFIAPVVTGITNFITGSLSGGSPDAQSNQTKITQLRQTIQSLQQAKAPQASITPYQNQLKELERQQKALNEATTESVELNESINKVVADRRALAEAATALEQNRLVARRDDFALQQSALEIQKAQNELTVLDIRLQGQLSADKKQELELERNLTQEQLKQLEAAQKNALIQAQIQIDRDISSNQQAALGIQLQRFAVEQKIEDLRTSSLHSYADQIQLEKDVLTGNINITKEKQRVELIGVNELEVQKAIRNKYAEQIKLLEQQALLRATQLRQNTILERAAERQIESDRELVDFTARQNQLAQIEQMDPFRNFSFAGAGLGFFAESEQFQADRIAESARQLELYNEQIAKTQSLLKPLRERVAQGLLDPDAIKTQEDNLKNLIQTRDLYQELQPAIDRTAIAQARFNDAFAAVSPIVSSLTNSLKEVVDGTKSAQEAFANFLEAISNMLLEKAALMIAQYIAIGIARAFAFGIKLTTSSGVSMSAGQATQSGFNMGSGLAAMLPGRANGGPVTGGSPYIVGERGPELFVPGRSGTVVPNDKLGGDNINVVVNVDAKGTSVQGNDQQGNQLGRVLSATIQQELIKQKRPGGLLA